MRDNFGWIQKLAQNEIVMEEHGVVDFQSDFDVQVMVGEATVQLLGELKNKFESYIEIFNAVRNNNSGINLIKLYRISNTTADFMVFRNSIKLIVSNTDPGIINVSFVNHVRNNMVFAAGAETRLSPPPFAKSGDNITASMGPFGEIQWTYRGEKINTDQLTRYYLTEFVKQSAR